MKKALYLLIFGGLFIVHFGFAQTAVPFKEGLAVGPCHQYGREAIYTDQLTYQLIRKTFQTPAEGKVFLTDAQGKEQKWQRITTDTSHRFRHNALTNGYLYLTYTSPKETVALLHVAGHAGLYFNGAPRGGDANRYGYMYSPVKLKKGLNEVLVRVGMGGRFQGVSAELIFSEKNIQLSTPDITLPNVVLSENNGQLLGGIVLFNLTEKPLTNLKIRAFIQGKEMISEVPVVSAMNSRKVGFRMDASAVQQKGDVVCELTLLQNGKAVDQSTIKLQAVASNEHYSNTFISGIDGSVQYFGVAPQKGGQTDTAALFLSVHGAGVEAIGQARAYKPKEWGTLVAPTNRRPRGFNWEDWGRIDALEVLEVAQKKFKPHPQKIYLTGHSMGGHGSWYLGATYPGKWAGVAPCAGYPTLMGYGSADGKIPENSTNPMEKMLLRASNPSNVMALASNYKASGIYVLHGDADRTVSVEYARTMRKVLGAFHNDFSYYEYPNGSHWYGDHSVDWPALFDFFKWHRSKNAEEKDVIDFTTANPAISANYLWAGIEQQETPLNYSRIQAKRNVNDKSVIITTENARTIMIMPGAFAKGQTFKVTVDETVVCAACVLDEKPLYFTKKEKWEAVEKPALAQRGSHRNGTFKAAFNYRMVFVYGTTGTKEENEWAYNKARYDAETWYYRGNGAVDVISDREFTPAAYPDRGVVLFGNATTNGAWSALLSQSPIQIQRGSIKIGEEQIVGDDLAAYFTYPRPDSPVASVAVVAGSGLAGMLATESNQYFTGGSGFPDYFIFGADMLKEGTKGVKQAGFFDTNWQITKVDAVKAQ
ncbi:alpha/beta hydrolase-fold protein [Runella aurantiaca]|uniref:Alpha/beta hydrolase n=1 Tax=Runella aurantiaca TaxID=2282308 RepID=A0A369ILL5_9BACT|nr:alpha/beta hydrolase-fold protein [Runella aurantiaca]RDB07536.1 alpha/beta hydrolase [Runella aurantiaca]